MFNSMVYSSARSIASGMQSDYVVGFGAGSYNLSKNQLGYLGKKGNSAAENWGYALGALANLGDVTNVVDAYTHWEDKLAAKAQAYMDDWISKNPDAVVDPSTVGRNAGRSYPSYFGKNPKYWNSDLNKWDDYMGMVDNWSWREYAGYLHDAEYIQKGIESGAKYLLASNHTWGADLRLLSRTLYLGLKHNSLLEVGIGGALGGLNAGKISYGWFVKRPPY